MVMDLFCAFQPKRVMVPSFPLRLGWPVMPSSARSSVGGVVMGEDLAILNGFDQAESQHRQGNAERQIAGP